MLKRTLLAAAMLIFVPAVAQTSAGEGQTTAPGVPASPQSAVPSAPSADPAAPVANAQAPAAPLTASQIAEVIAREFPSYDRNGDGLLSRFEFDAWMTALRKASDPALQDDAGNRTYLAGAFATADTDRSKSVSKDELIAFITQS